MIKSLKLRVSFIFQAVKLAFNKPSVAVKNTLMTIQWDDSKNITNVRAWSKSSYLALVLGLVVNLKRQDATLNKYDNQEYVDFCTNALKHILVKNTKIKRIQKMRKDFKKSRGIKR